MKTKQAAELPHQLSVPTSHNVFEEKMQSQASFQGIVRNTIPVPWMMSERGERLAAKSAPVNPLKD